MFIYSVMYCIMVHVVTKGRFPLPEFTGRVHGPSWRPENSGAFFDTRQLGPWTRVVETGRPCKHWLQEVFTDRNYYTKVDSALSEVTDLWYM